MVTYVVDTHALVWFLSEDSKLSANAAEILRQGESGKVEIVVPTIVLAEMLFVCEKKRVSPGFSDLLEAIPWEGGFVVAPLDFAIVEGMIDLPQDLEIHDRVIAATALSCEATVITKDRRLRECSLLATVW